MTRVILVRHGQTAWNRAERFRGHSDVPLNSTGLAQAHAAARRIVSTWRVDAVYTSPLRRALETAQAIAQRCGLKAEPRDGLIDLNFGAWQGMTYEEAATAYPDEYALWRSKPQRLRLPEGESVGRARRRSFAAMLELALAHPEGTIVLVSHQVICRLLALAALGLSTAHYWQIQQETTAINVFEYVDGGWATVTLNDTCHLHEGPL